MWHTRICFLYVAALLCTSFPKAQNLSVPLPGTDPELPICLAFVKGATFLMGSRDGQSDEQPEHWVRLEDFYIGCYEVTQREWTAVMGTNPSEKKGADLPVENVSYEEVLQFIDRLNARGNGSFRLPTEAEWEYAARGGKKTKQALYAGSDSIEEVAWYGQTIRYSPLYSAGGSRPVGEKAPNALGIYDMSGNVAEWCADWYATDYYATSPRRNPAGPDSGAQRVIRGGGWYNDALFCRVSARYSAFPGDAEGHIGFRLVYVPSPD